MACDTLPYHVPLNALGTRTGNCQKNIPKIKGRGSDFIETHRRVPKLQIDNLIRQHRLPAYTCNKAHHATSVLDTNNMTMSQQAEQDSKVLQYLCSWNMGGQAQL